jgi:2'-5' RNA ligase superfamily
VSRRNYVVAFPAWAGDAGVAVEAFRRLHDPHAALLGAHFTLVFGSTLAVQAIADEVRAVAAIAACVPFVAHRAACMPSGDGATLAVLLPDPGQAGIGVLHEALHRGVLAPERRRGVDLDPHLTIGRAATPALAQALCDRWNDTGVEPHGVLEALAVGTLEDGAFCVASTHRLQALR